MFLSHNPHNHHHITLFSLVLGGLSKHRMAKSNQAVVQFVFALLWVWAMGIEAPLSMQNHSSFISASMIRQVEGEIGFVQSIATTEDSPIFVKHSKFQKIEIFKSNYFGKILVLDGVIQLTERDADAYNEMMAHMPMFQHRNPRRVLIIGGGDGYVLNEVLRHSSVDHVDQVDLDEDVISVCREHFAWGSAWDDPRVHLHIGDGAEFVRGGRSLYYDVVIQDSSDPWTSDENGSKRQLPSGVLYAEEHFAAIYDILTPDGVFNLQAEAFHIPSDMEGIMEWRIQAMRTGFQSARYGTIFVISYPTGQIGFLLCEKNPEAASPRDTIDLRFTELVRNGSSTSYYHPPLHYSSFDLPFWVHRKVYGDNGLQFCSR